MCQTLQTSNYSSSKLFDNSVSPWWLSGTSVTEIQNALITTKLKGRERTLIKFERTKTLTPLLYETSKLKGWEQRWAQVRAKLFQQLGLFGLEVLAWVVIEIGVSSKVQIQSSAAVYVDSSGKRRHLFSLIVSFPVWCISSCEAATILSFWFMSHCGLSPMDNLC